MSSKGFSQAQVIDGEWEQPLGFDYDEGHRQQNLTAWAGIPLLLQAFRSLDLPRSVERNVRVKQRQRGLDEASY
jgi:hypothetical protein